MPENYLTKRWSLDKLRELAEHCDRVRKGKPLPAMDFLQRGGIIPYGIVWKRGNSIPRTRLSAAGIEARYLAEVAHDWDKDGDSTATEFVEAIAFEVEGTPLNDAVREVTEGLGREE